MGVLLFHLIAEGVQCEFSQTFRPLGHVTAPSIFHLCQSGPDRASL